jgi:hypothetical protein
MDERSERLRQRRKRSTERTASSERGADGDPDTDTPRPDDDADADAEADGESDDGGHVPIKEKQTGTYMYLPESQAKELRRLYNVLKAEYEFEYDEEFEKNRHFYPLAVQHGLESLEGMDSSEIREHLDELYE